MLDIGLWLPLLLLFLNRLHAMELVKPRLFIPKDSYEEFLVKGPVTVSYVATVVNGTAVDVVVLDKENFIRFANKVDSEFNEEVWPPPPFSTKQYSEPVTTVCFLLSSHVS